MNLFDFQYIYIVLIEYINKKIMKNLNKTLAIKLTKLRKQGLEVSDINPISAQADIIYEKLNSGQINKNDINHTLKKLVKNYGKNKSLI